MRPVFLSRSHTIIECGAHRVTLGVFRLRDGRLSCEQSEVQMLPDGLQTETDWLEATGKALQALQAGPGPVVLVLPTMRTLLRMITLPRVSASQRAKIAAFEAGQSVPFPLDEMVWASVDAGESTAGRQALIVSAKRTVVETLCTAAAEAGFAPQAVWPVALTTLANFRLAVPAPAESCLFVLPGAAGIVLGQWVAARWALRVAPHAAKDEILVQEISRTKQHFEQTLGLPPPTVLYWAGENHGQGERLAQALGLRLELWDGGTPGGGAAAMSLLSRQACADLLPPERRAAQARRRRLPWVAVAAAALIAASVLPVVSARARWRNLQQQTAFLEKQLAPLRAAAARDEANRRQLDEIRREIGQWRSLEANRTSWLRLLADWQQRLAGIDDAWLEKLEILPAARTDEPLKLLVTGCLLARDEAQAKGGPALLARAKVLRESLRASPLVAAIESESYNTSQAGLVRFELVLVNRREAPL